MKTTRYFDAIRKRADRVFITDEWIISVIEKPEKTLAQADGRIKKWAKIPAMGNRYLRVVLLEDGVTVHNAFLDRSYKS